MSTQVTQGCSSPSGIQLCLPKGYRDTPLLMGSEPVCPRDTGMLQSYRNQIISRLPNDYYKDLKLY